MKRLREHAKDQIRVTQSTEGTLNSKEFQPEVNRNGGQAFLRAIVSVVNS